MTAFPKTKRDLPRRPQGRPRLQPPGYFTTYLKSQRIQKLKGGDRRTIPYDDQGNQDVEVPEYVEGRKYSRWELSLMAEAMLRADGDFRQGYYWLPWEIYRARKKREIYCSVGTPDPSIESGLYWRTHPDGRKVNSDEARQKHGASFYK